MHGKSCSLNYYIFLKRIHFLWVNHFSYDPNYLFFFRKHDPFPFTVKLQFTHNFSVKRLPAMRETRVRFLSWEDPLEKEMEIHSSTLAWKIPWTEEPDRLQCMGSKRVRHDLATEPPEAVYCLMLLSAKH